MKVIFALLVLVAVASLVQCMSTGSSSTGSSSTPSTATTSGPNSEWPGPWMAFASLVGQCESYRIVLTDPHMDAEDIDTILNDACKITIGVAEHVTGDDIAQSIKAGELVEAAFPVIQCVNLEVDKELLSFLMDIAGEKENKFMTGAQHLFDICHAVFESVENEDHILNQMLNDLDESILDKRASHIATALRELLAVMSKRR